MPDDDEGDAGDSDGDDDMPDDDSGEGSESDEEDDDDDDDDDEEEPPPPRRRRQARPRRRIRTKQSPFEQPGGKPGAAGGLQVKAFQTKQQKRLINRLTSRLPELSATLEETLHEGFFNLGAFVSDNLNEHLPLFQEIVSAWDDSDLPGDLTRQDLSGVMQAIDSMALEQWKDDAFGAILEEHAETVTTDTIRILEEELELPFDIPDEVAREIIATGGKRVGLIDVNKNTKAAVFNALRTGGRRVRALRR